MFKLFTIMPLQKGQKKLRYNTLVINNELNERPKMQFIKLNQILNIFLHFPRQSELLNVKKNFMIRIHCR